MKGEFLDFEAISSAFTVQVRSRSSTVMSASAPSVSAGGVRLISSAGRVDIMRIICSRLIRPGRTSRSRTRPTAVSSPVMPKDASGYSTSFSSTWCGAWSVAITSMVPSRTPSRIAWRSASSRSGGFILVWVE